jgi:hypothetical protein
MSILTDCAFRPLQESLRTPVVGASRLCKLLVASVGEKKEAISHTHGEGFTLDRDALRTRLNIEATYEHIPGLAKVRDRIERTRPDVVILMPTWRDSAEAVVAAFRDLHEMPDRPRLVYLDWFAPTSSPHFAVLPYVDRYLKRNILVDFAGYRREYVGGYEVAQFVAQLLKLDLGDWRFGSEIPPGQEHKLWLGWNFGVGETYRRLTRFGRVLGRSWALRHVDVNRRLGPPSKSNAPNEWYQNYRDAALHALDPLAAKWRCSGYERIPRRKYLLELLRSRVVFSPFGWGEVCFRDYEAVACGALLVKPAMEHLITSPNIYVDGETYVSVKWDLSDSAEKITHYLEHPDAAKKIAKNAQELLWAYYREHRFVDDVARSLRGLLPV